MLQSNLYDAVIVPGGGVGPSGKLPPWVENRLDKALELANGAPIITLSAGTPHKPPPYDERGRPILEAVAEAEYLREQGYPSDLLFTETASYDTIGNAYFVRVIHTDPAGFRKLMVVTSEFHMPRTEALFRWIFQLTPVDASYQLNFQSVPDFGMERDILEARRQKETRSLASIPKLAEQHRTLASFHCWLFTRHAAYAIEKPPEQSGNELLLKSY